METFEPVVKPLIPKWTMGVIAVALMVIGVMLVWGRSERLIDREGVGENLPGVSDQKKLLRGFPDVPIYPGAELKDSTAVSPGEGEDLHYEATWTTVDAVPLVADWYKAELEKTGWTIDVMPDDPNNTENQYMVAKKDGKLLQLSLIKNEISGFTEVTAAFPARTEYVEEEEE